MGKYYIDDRATGANNGDLNGGVPDANGIVQDAFQTKTDMEAGVPTNGVHTLICVSGSGPYPAPWDGVGNTKTIEGNGCVVDGSVDLNGSAYKWTKSVANPLVSYIEAAAGGDPSLVEPKSGTINGKYQETNAEEAQYQMGAAGSLDDEFIAWQVSGAGPDSLAFDTVYARYDAGLSSITIKVAQVDYCWDTNFTSNVVNDLILMYSNIELVRYRAGSSTQTQNRCAYLYGGDGQGIDCQQANNVVINSGIGFFAGHRFATASSALSGNITLNDCLDVNSHLFGLIHASYTNTYLMRNCIIYNQSAGGIDTNANTLGTFAEHNNHWYPSFNGGGALEYPDGTDNTWTTTDAADLPPSLDTGANTRAAIDAAMVVAGYESGDPKFTNINLRDFFDCDFRLQPDSPCLGKGIEWQDGVNLIGYDGEPKTKFDRDIGPFQSTYSPFHAANQ